MDTLFGFNQLFLLGLAWVLLFLFRFSSLAAPKV